MCRIVGGKRTHRKEKTVDKNQKKSPVPAPVETTNIGQALLREARRSKKICVLLAKALLRPEPFFPLQPNLPTSELIATLRLALLAPTDLGRDRAPEEHGEWYDYLRNISLWCLTQRLPMPKDVRAASSALHAFQAFFPEDVVLQTKAGLQALEEKYEERIKLLTAPQPNKEMKVAATAELMRLRQTPRPRRRGGRPVTSRGGRAISEHQQRIVAVAFLLEDCGEANPEKVIVSLLRDLNMNTKPSKVIRTVATYKDAAETRTRTDAFIIPEDLLDSWLEWLGRFYQFWRLMTRGIAGTRGDGSLQGSLEAFVKDFLKSATYSVTCPPWRWPSPPTGIPTFLWREGRFDKPFGPRYLSSTTISHDNT